MQTTTLMFKFDGIYDTSDLAKYIGNQLGIKLIATKPGDKVHGHISASLNVTPEKPLGFTILQIHFNNHEESPNWDEKTKEGHQSHLMPYHPNTETYDKLQEAFVKLFNNDEDTVKQMNRAEIAKLLN